jgi:hypothetical protein
MEGSRRWAARHPRLAETWPAVLGQAPFWPPTQAIVDGAVQSKARRGAASNRYDLAIGERVETFNLQPRNGLLGTLNCATNCATGSETSRDPLKTLGSQVRRMGCPIAGHR